MPARARWFRAKALKGATAEDEGYLVTFLIDENSGTSQLAILDASDVTKGPICRAQLPHKISSGVHSTWVEHTQLREDARAKRDHMAAQSAQFSSA